VSLAVFAWPVVATSVRSLSELLLLLLGLRRRFLRFLALCAGSLAVAIPFSETECKHIISVSGLPSKTAFPVACLWDHFHSVGSHY